MDFFLFDLKKNIDDETGEDFAANAKAGKMYISMCVVLWGPSRGPRKADTVI